MSTEQIKIHAFYAPVGFRAYKCLHVQLLMIEHGEVFYRFKDEFSAHRMPINEFMVGYESLSY